MGQAPVNGYVHAREAHQDGGIHSHLAVKLDRQKRWLSVRNTLDRVHGIKVNLSDGHTNYFDAEEYVTKSDEEFIESQNHPDLTAGFVPRKNSASNTRRSTSSASEPSQKKGNLILWT